MCCVTLLCCVFLRDRQQHCCDSLLPLVDSRFTICVYLMSLFVCLFSFSVELMRGSEGQILLVGTLSPHRKGAFILLLFAALTFFAAVDSDAATFTVPCHQTSTVNVLRYDNGTTFLISGCSGVNASAASSAPLVTYFQLRFDIAAPTQALPSAISVLAVNSVNVAIIIVGNSSLSQLVEGLTIIMRNVTNVATPSPSGVSCVTTPTHPWCVPMLTISGIWQLVALQVLVTDVAQLRNTTFMIGVTAWAAMERGVISVSSCSFTGIVGILQIINAVTSRSAIVAGTNISISNASVDLVGAALQPGVVYPAVLRLSNANISGSLIVLHTVNINDRLSYASGNAVVPLVAMCPLFNAILDSATSLSLQHFTVSLRSEVSAYLCYLSNTTMSHFALLEIVDALMLGGPSSSTIVVMSVVASSTVSSSRIDLQDITVHCSQLIGSCGIVTMSAAELLHRFTVRLADSQINSSGRAYILSVANIAMKNGSLMVENVYCKTGHSQAQSIAFTASSVESAELLLNNVTVVGGYAALYIVNVPVVSNATITMASCLCSAYFAAFFSVTTFWNTTATVHRPIGSPAVSFGIDRCLIQGGSQWTLELPTTTSGQMLFVRNVTIADASAIIVDASNATIAREASFTDTLFFLQGIRLEGTSTLLVRLPQMLERRSPESVTPPVYLSDNVIAGGSRLVVQGLSELLWTTVLWATSSIIHIQFTTIEDGASMLVCYFEFQNINNASTTTSRGILVGNATITNGGTMRFASLMMRLDLTKASVVGSAVSEMIQLASIDARQNSTGIIVDDATCVHDVSLFTRCILLYRATLSAGAHFTTRNISATMFATSQFIALSDCSASTGAAITAAQDSRIVLTYMGSLYPMNREVNVVVVVNSAFGSGSTLTVLEGAFMTATNQPMAPAASTISVLRFYNTSVVGSNLTLRNVVVVDFCLPDVSSSVQVVNISGASIIAHGAALSLESISLDCLHASLLQSAVDTRWGDTAVTTQLLILQRIVAARCEALVVLNGNITGRNITVVVSQCEFKDAAVILAKQTSSLGNAADVAVSFNDVSFTASTTNPQQIVSLSVSSPSMYYRVTFTRATVVSPWWGGRPSSGCPTTTATTNASAALQCPTVLVSVPSRGATPTVHLVVDDTLIIGDALLFSAAPEVVVDAQVFCSRWGRHVFSAPSWITMNSPPIAGATQLLASNRSAVNITMYPYSIANTSLPCPSSLRLSALASSSHSSSLPSEPLSRTHSLSLHSVSHVDLTVSQTTSWTVTSALCSLTASSLSRSLSRSHSPSTTLSYDKYPSSTATITTTLSAIDTTSLSNTMRSRSMTLTTSPAGTTVSQSSSSCMTMTQETLTATQNRSSSFSGSSLSISVTMSSHDSPSLTLPLNSPSTALVQTGVSVAALTATAGAILSGGAVGAIGEAASFAALSMITCGGQRTWESNTGIQRLVISVFYDLGPVASVWGNLGLIIGVFLVHVLAATVAPRVSSSWTAARLRFPSHSNVVFLFLLPGVMFASVRCLDATVATDVASGAVGLAAGVGAFITTVWHTATHVWPVISTISLEGDFAAFLPLWCWRYLRAALPTHTWVPQDMRLQHYSMVGAVASRQQLPLQPFFHAHGAVLALISGIPFSTSACVAQFTLVAIWLLVPIWLFINRRLRIFRRPPSNVLSLATFVVSACLIVSTAVHYEGPESTRLGAATAMSVFGYLLTVASVLKLLASLFAVGTERLVRRKHRQPLKCTAASSNNKELCHTSGSTLLLPDSAPLTTTALWMLHQPRVVEGGSELHSHDGNQVRRITSFALLAPNDDITWKHWQLQRQLAVVRLDTQIRSMLDEQLLHTTPTVDAHAALDLLIQRAAIPL